LELIFSLLLGEKEEIEGDELSGFSILTKRRPFDTGGVCFFSSKFSLLILLLIFGRVG